MNKRLREAKRLARSLGLTDVRFEALRRHWRFTALAPAGHVVSTLISTGENERGRAFKNLTADLKRQMNDT